MRISEKDKQRFWAKVSKGTSTECWHWTSARHSAGYGVFHLDGETVYAHRVAWVLTSGPIPNGKLICHTCDNRLCANPSHLFIGAYADNTADMMGKGRQRNIKGEAVPNSKLTCEQVQAIRSRYPMGGITHRELGREYGVNPATITRVLNRESWAWLTDNA